MVNRWIEASGKGHNIPALATYMAVVSVVGIAMVSRNLFLGPLPGLWTTILYVSMGIIGEHLYIKFPSGSILSLGETAAFAALWCHGLPLAMASVAIPVLTQFVTQRRAVLNSLFNAAQSGISLRLASLVISLTCGVPWHQEPKGQVLCVLLMIVSYDLVNALFVAAACAIDNGERLERYYVRVAYLDRKHSLAAWYLVNITTTLLSLHLGNIGIVFVFAGILALWGQLKSEQELRTKSLEARTDPLTGLGNLRYLDDWLNLDFPRLVAKQMPCSVIFVDIDGLKEVNDSMGHDAGDAALVHLASVLRSVVRSEDKIVRYGGDEFLILLKKIDLKGAEIIGQRILEALHKAETFYEGQMVSFGISVGVASFPEHTALGRDLIRMADKAMYLAKTSGGNAVYSADSL